MLAKNKQNQITEPTDTPLHKAVADNNIDAVKTLLSNGADVNAIGRFGETPLHRAAYHNLDKITALLLEHGAKIDVKRSDGEQPIHVAAMLNSAQVMGELLKHDKRQLTALGQDFRTPFIKAIMTGSQEVLRVLLSHGDDINQLDAGSGRKALHIAVINNDDHTAEFLINNGINLTFLNDQGLTLLQWCVSQKRPSFKVVTLLIEKGADVNEGNPSPLFLLASHTYSQPVIPELAEHLIKRGAKVEYVINGKTAMDVLENKKKQNKLKPDEIKLYHLLESHLPKKSFWSNIFK